METSDRQLLNRYIATHDEAAFRALVLRHLPLVHGIARRVTANDGLAEDVAQNTFIRLAERAALIPQDLPLPVWLHRVCRHLAIDLVRAEERRKKREQQTSTTMPESAEAAWPALAPVVDQLVNELPAAERSVLVLRYYCDQPHAAIASQLGVTEAVARKRASRALERLRTLLAKRGIATSAAALASLLPANAAAPVPVALAPAVLQATKGVALLTPTPLHAAVIAMNATQKSIVAAAALIFLMSATYSVVASQQQDAATAASNRTAAVTPEAGTRMARTRTERRAAATSAERLAWLREILELESPAKRQREMIALIDTLAPGQYRELVELLAERNRDRYISVDEYHLLLAAWTKVDAGAALEHVAAGDNMYHLGEVLQNWAAQDPSAALAWANANPVGEKNNVSLGYVLAGISTMDMQRAVDLIQAIPEKTRRIETLLDLWSNIQDQADAFDQLLPRIGEQEMRERLVERCVPTLAGTNPSKAVRLLLLYPAAGGSSAINEIFSRWVTEQSESAIQGLTLLPPGGQRVYATMTVCAQVANKDPARAFEVLKQYPETATDKSMANLAAMSVLKDPPGMLGRIQGVQDTAVRDKYLLSALRTWREYRQEEAQDWIGRNPLSESVRQRLTETPAKPGAFSGNPSED